MEIFGFTINRKTESQARSVITPENEDGALQVLASGGGMQSVIDIEGAAKTESELVGKYREIAAQPEIEFAIDDIINEAMATDEDEVVSLNIDENSKIPANIIKKITEEFNEVKNILNFDNLAYDIFKKFYVDGRLRYHIILHENKTKGIRELRYIDPRKIRKVREIKEVTVPGGGTIQEVVEEYYLYSENAFSTLSPEKDTGIAADYRSIQTVKISKDSVAEITSGIMDKNNRLVLSFLNKAIKPLNQLRILEDSIVIYRISRAPERRAFYVDVSGLPRGKAESYVRDMMTKHKNKVTYDSATGQIKNSPSILTMMDDYWFPRRGDGKATEVQSLSGGENLGELNDINYFLEKLYKSLNIPFSRINPEASFNFGRQSEITRDELKFTKFIGRLRKRFANIFLNILEMQLVSKKIMSTEDWKEIKNFVKIQFASDSYFSEVKYSEILRGRLETLQMIDNYKGEFFSKNWIWENVLQLSDEEIEEMKKQMEEDEASGEDEDDEDMFGGQQEPAMQPQMFQLTPAPAPKEPEKGEEKPPKDGLSDKERKAKSNK